MKMTKRSNQSGLIKAIILVAAALVLLKYIYNVDIIGFLTQGKPKEVLDKIYSWGSEGWEKYKYLLEKIWDYLFGFIKNHFGK